MLKLIKPYISGWLPSIELWSYQMNFTYMSGVLNHVVSRSRHMLVLQLSSWRYKQRFNY